MGKKLRGAALRAKKRAREAVEEIQEQQAQQAAQQSVHKLSNEQLFCLDTAGSDLPKSSSKKRRQNDQSGDDHTNNKKLPAHEQQQVDALVKRYSAKQLAAAARQGKAQLTASGGGGRVVRTRGMRAGSTSATFDLWNEKNDDTKSDNKTKKSKSAAVSHAIGSTLAGTAPAHVVVQARRKVSEDQGSTASASAAVAVDVARDGQSYHPDPVSHAAVLKDAVAVEEARQAALAHRAAPIAQGLSAETRALLVGDSSDESDSSSDDSDSHDSDEEDDKLDMDAEREKRLDATAKKPKDESSRKNEIDDSPKALMMNKRHVEKKTRAQRNKEQRLRQQEAIRRKQKAAKKLVKEISEVHRYNKEFKLEKQQRTAAKQQVTAKQQQAATAAGKDLTRKWSQRNPIHAPTYPVALPSEVAVNKKKTKDDDDNNNTNASASLRTLKPKGSLVTDRMASWQDRNLARFGRGSHKKRRKKAVRGIKNNIGKGDTFLIKG